MKGSFGPSSYACKLRLDAGDDEVSIRLSFNTNLKRVNLDWQFTPAGGSAGWKLDGEAVPFYPTAVCSHAGESAVFYVGGYNERLAATVVEEWTLLNVALVSSIAPDGSTSTDVTYSIRRETLASAQNAPLIRAMAFQLFSGKLLLIGELSPEIWSLDPVTGTLTLEHDEQQIQNLGVYLSFSTALVDVTAQQPGFIVLGKPWRAWMEGSANAQQYDPGTVLLLRDEDLDGTFDEIAELTWQEFLAREYFTHEVLAYK